MIQLPCFIDENTEARETQLFPQGYTELALSLRIPPSQV